MKFLSFMFILSFSFHAYSYSCEQTSKQELESIIQNTTLRYFPNLDSENISIREFTSDAYFLRSKPKISSLFGSREERKYFVEINTKLYGCSPSELALEAIIAHELTHINDYHSMSIFQIIGLASKYISKTARAEYERQTDEKVVHQGMGEGLIEYRNWIYQRLTPKELELKRLYYLTPEEILEKMD